MRRSTLLLFVLSLTLLAACGGGGGDDIPTAPPATRPPPPPPPPPTPPPPPPVAEVLCPPGGELGLAVGEQVIFRNQSTYCFNFASSGSVTEYLVGVQSVGEAGIAIRNITVRGERVTTTALQASVQETPPIRPDVGGAPRFSPALSGNPGFKLLRDHRSAHNAMLARMIGPLREPGARQPLIDRAAQGAPAQMLGVVTGNEEIGDQVELRVRDLNSIDCEAPATELVMAELRIVHEQSMWFVDIENPTGGFTDEQLQEMADIFDEHIYATETEYLGVSNDLDGNARIVIVVTQQLNIGSGDLGLVLGFVNPCDFFTRGEDVGGQTIHSTNEGEFFYALAPDPEASVGETVDTEALLGLLPLIISHEFAHIIQNSHRFTQDGALMAAFMAEGQATLAEEVVGHSILGNATGQNLNVAEALDYDNIPFPFWYANPWTDLGHYFGWPGVPDFNENTPRIEGAPQECTWTDAGEDDPCISRPLWYGVTWSLLRWAADQFGEDFGGEPALHQAIIRNNIAGFDNLREVLAPYGLLEDLLAQWAAAFYMDDRPGQSDPRHSVSSWDYFSADTRLFEQAWLEPITKSYSDFTENVRVRDPSTAFFLVGGGIAPQYSIKVEGAGGGSLGSDIQVWIVRTK